MKTHKKSHNNLIKFSSLFYNWKNNVNIYENMWRNLGTVETYKYIRDTTFYNFLQHCFCVFLGSANLLIRSYWNMYETLTLLCRRKLYPVIPSTVFLLLKLKLTKIFYLIIHKLFSKLICSTQEDYICLWHFRKFIR